MQLSEFHNLVKKGKSAVPAIILLESADAYIIKSVKQGLRLALFDTEELQALIAADQETSFNLGEKGAQVLADFLNSLKSMSLFASHKLIILREVEQLSSVEERLLTDELIGLKQAAALKDRTLLIQCGKLRANARLKTIVNDGGLHLAPTLNQKPQYVTEMRRLAAAKGLNLTPSILEFLTEVLPMDLSRLESELEKLSLYAGKNGNIELSAVSKLVYATNLDSVFRLTDAIGERNSKTALQVLRQLCDAGESPQMLLAMIARQMRHLYRVKLVEKMQMKREGVLQALETHSNFVLEKAVRQARNFNLASLGMAQKSLQRLDMEMKRSRLECQPLLEKCVIELAGTVS